MEVKEFLENLSDCFDDTEAGEITVNAVFKDFDEWDSLSALAIIAMCHKKYGVKLTGAEIREAETIMDLYNLVESKL
ncbi:MAG: acyl carrier protein [Bacteroidia bacterium]|nr:acyl carrier protein [Bacteroidia bacterium]